MNVAQLKQIGDASFVRNDLRFPRLNERGSIEAVCRVRGEALKGFEVSTFE